MQGGPCHHATVVAVRSAGQRMEHDTEIGGVADAFPLTRGSAVLAAKSGDLETRRRAHVLIVAAYWKPVYKHVRLKWRAANEDAKDLTQAFFTHAIEKGVFERYDPRQAAFRTYLRVCLDRFVSNERLAQSRLKRGGGSARLSLDFEGAEQELSAARAPAGDDPQRGFERECLRSLFAQAIDEFRAACEAAGHATRLRLFERYDLCEPSERAELTYQRLAADHGLKVTDVTNHLAAARRMFREILLQRLRALCGSEQEFRAEARAILGGS